MGTPTDNIKSVSVENPWNGNWTTKKGNLYYLQHHEIFPIVYIPIIVIIRDEEEHDNIHN